jgi:glycine/D-amino acid oxidase-like deaminating enzyme
MIGQIPGTNVWAAFGHYRNGILLAPETARIIAEQIHT